MYDNNKGRKEDFIPMIWSFRKSLDKRIIRTHRASSYYSLVAEWAGFEPACRFIDNTISSRARYDHFDTTP